MNAPASPPKRLSLSEIVSMLLTRSGGSGSSVTLSRNARGVTQIEVTVRTGDEDDLQTPEQAAERCNAIYASLRATYPMPDGYVGAEGGSGS